MSGMVFQRITLPTKRLIELGTKVEIQIQAALIDRAAGLF
jgi:hypothetical protein